MARRSDEDFGREIDAHIALETDRLIADGIDPVEARARARRTFGNVTLAREDYHVRHHVRWWEELRHDVRSAARNARRNPVSATVVVLSLAAGIGAATVALVVRNAMFYNPPPLYQSPALLSKVQAGPRDRPIFPAGSEVPVSLFMQWRQTFGSRLAAAVGGRPADLERPDGREPVMVRAVTPNLFPVLGIRPEVGRLFNPEGTAGLTGEVVLSYNLWKRLFGSRPDIGGTHVSINGVPATVIGVLPERFWFMDMGDQVYVAVDPRVLPADTRLQIVIRRADDVGERDLAAQLQGGLASYNRERPVGTPEWHLRVSGIGGTPLGAAMALFLPYMFAVAVTLTLFIACANAAVLLIAQWTARETDTAVRTSLGASRPRLVRALITEAVVAGLSAGALAVVATIAIRWWVINRSGIDLAKFDLTISARVLAQAALLAIGAGVVAGLGPAIYETARLQINPLRGLQSSDRVRQRWSHTLVVGEIAVTVALLVVASTLVSGYQRMKDAQFGFDTTRVAVTAISNGSGVAVRPLLDTVATVPGVRSVAMAARVPLFSARPQREVALNAAGDGAMRAQHNNVTAEFFTVLDVPVVAGRFFLEHETPDAAVAIVNQTLARRLFGAGPAVGQQLWMDKKPLRIVGVVKDYATSFQEFQAIAPKVFVPLAPQDPDTRALFVLVRGDGNPTTLLQPLQRAVRSSGRDNTIVDAFGYAQRLAIGNSEWLLTISSLAPLISIGMAMTAAGIYGVLAFALARRTRELAVRVALGASARDQAVLVGTHSGRLVALGAGIGVGLTFALSRVLRAAGGGGTIYDPPWAAFVVPVILIVVVAGLATWLPTLRARRIDTVVLLRST